MSAEGQAYVESNSPYSGLTYLVHLRLGMLANETYGYRIFIGDRRFAELCRCSEKTLQRARQQMIDDGFLALIKPARGQKVAEYQFLFPKVGGQNDHLVGGQNDEVGGHPVQVGGHPVQIEDPTPINRIKEELNESNSRPNAHPFANEFEQLWVIYPRKIGRKSAYDKVVAQLRRGVEFSTLYQATENYAKLRSGQEEKYTLHPSTFYGSSNRYEDYLQGGAGVSVTATQKQSRSDIALAEFVRRRASGTIDTSGIIEIGAGDE
jgi:hypothetical protein